MCQGCSSLEHIKIKAKEVKGAAFRSCTNLSRVEMDSVEFIGDRAFSYCTSLKQINLPTTLTKIEKHVFYGAGLTYIKFPGNLNTIESRTCHLCDSLKTLIVSDSTEHIISYAFTQCASLERVYIPGSVIGMGSNVFSWMPSTSIAYVKYESQVGMMRNSGWPGEIIVYGDEPPVRVNVTKSIENGGTIQGYKMFLPGDTAKLEAFAGADYMFEGWKENGRFITTESKLSFMVTESRDLIAVFTPRANSGKVHTSSSDSSTTITWEPTDGAIYYDIKVYDDEDMQVLADSIRYEEVKAAAVTRATFPSYDVTIEGLTANVYYYSISAYGEIEKLLSKYIGSFSRDASAIKALSNEAIKIEVAMGGVWIRNTDCLTRIYNLQGECVAICLPYKDEQFVPLNGGIYIINAGEKRSKIFVK